MPDDDGLSTGALRNFVPGMLGPSDFRKTCLTCSISTRRSNTRCSACSSTACRSTSRRLTWQGFRSYVEGEHGALPRSPLPALFGALDENARRRTLALLRQFFRYHATRSGEWPLNFVDCSLGNLIFAGAYLERGRDFNAAARTLAEMVDSQARLIDVSKGECRTLVGLKADGTLLPREAEIGGKQSAVPILETFFLDEVPDAAAWAAIADGTVEAKLSWLRAREQHVEPSEEARSACRRGRHHLWTRHAAFLAVAELSDCKARDSSPAPPRSRRSSSTCARIMTYRA